MKLLIACVATLSLFGCADEPTSYGGDNLEGIRPAKPSIDDPTNTGQPARPKIFEGMNDKTKVHVPDLGVEGAYAETIKPEGPVPGVCDNCEVIAIHVPIADKVGIEDVTMISSDGAYLCKLKLQQNGTVSESDCGWYR